MAIARSIIGLVVAVVLMLILFAVTDSLSAQVFNATPDPVAKSFPTDANFTGYCAMNTAGYFVVTLIAAFVAALIAGHRPMLHAGVLAAIIVCIGVAFFFVGPKVFEQYGATMPSWYLPALPILGGIGALLGGKLKARGRAPAVSNRT